MKILLAIYDYVLVPVSFREIQLLDYHIVCRHYLLPVGNVTTAQPSHRPIYLDLIWSTYPRAYNTL